MNEIKENFFENNALFKFKTYSCDMVTDVIHTNPNKDPIYEYKLTSNINKLITLAYAPKKGLVRIASNGSIEETNILGIFISLCEKNEKDLIKFVNENGFIFPVECNNYEKIKKEVLTNILTRLKLTIELMSDVSSIKKNYYKIVSSIIKLLFYAPIEFKTELMKENYNTHHYNYVDLLKSTGGTLSIKRQQQEFNSDVFTIEEDTIFPNYEVNITHYNSYMSSTNVGIFKNILHLYVNTDFENDIERKISDVLFHSLEKCQSLENFLADESNVLLDLNKIDNKFKETIIEVANYIIGEEINSNLTRIRPFYDSNKKSPSWVIDDLLSALYFSIFYLDPNLELYRQCSNPKCNKWFLVKTTSTKKKYCSEECRNRVVQDRYRKRKKEVS